MATKPKGKKNKKSASSRFVNSNKAKKEIDEFSVRLGLVKMAYKSLNSGIHNNLNELSSSYQ